MNNREKTLFVFEGADTEGKYVRKLEQNFMGNREAIKCVFDAEIYQLYRIMKTDPDLPVDIVSLLKSRNNEFAAALEGYERDSFAYIYLFFDYDGHSSLADDSKIAEMLQFFDNETENGMLYISYPMVEAIKHYTDLENFQSLTVKCKRRNCPYIDNCDDSERCLAEPHYKRFVADTCLPQLNNTNAFTRQVWQMLIHAHLCKMNYIVNGVFELPDRLQTQSAIFSHQLDKYINKRCPEVAVLSAFPLYVLDYYGCDKLKTLLHY